MSHNTYQTKWMECMQELMEQVQIEYLPVEAAESGQPFEVGFQHFASGCKRLGFATGAEEVNFRWSILEAFLSGNSS